MRRELFICCLFCLSLLTLSAQEIPMQEVAALEQVYGDVQESEGLLPMNELGIEFGYALYEAEITVEGVAPILAVENIRDYASVYVDGRLQGWITDNQKNIKLTVSTGTHHLQLYAENIGRITYGPEILDNSKGLFGSTRRASATPAPTIWPTWRPRPGRTCAPCCWSWSRARAACSLWTGTSSAPWPACASSGTGCCWWTRCRPASAAPAPSSPSSSTASGPMPSPLPRASPAACPWAASL